MGVAITYCVGYFYVSIGTNFIGGRCYSKPVRSASGIIGEVRICSCRPGEVGSVVIRNSDPLGCGVYGGDYFGKARDCLCYGGGDCV